METLTIYIKEKLTNQIFKVIQHLQGLSAISDLSMQWDIETFNTPEMGHCGDTIEKVQKTFPGRLAVAVKCLDGKILN